MMKQTDNLFGTSAECPALFPPREARNGTRALSCPPQRCSPSGFLRNTAPDLFADLVRRYEAVLDEAVDQRIHENKSFSAALADLSARLGQLQAGARDIIELHARALDAKLASVPPLLRGVYVEEGRLVVLELMGRVLSAYRTAFLQATQASSNGS
jgi:hypothetical protein